MDDTKEFLPSHSDAKAQKARQTKAEAPPFFRKYKYWDWAITRTVPKAFAQHDCQKQPAIKLDG
jgi:hypothetical protein